MGILTQYSADIGGIDSALIDKIGLATLQTTAQDLSGAVNELVDEEVTGAERLNWNNKVTCYIDPNDSENLIFVNDYLAPAFSSATIMDTLLDCFKNVAWSNDDGVSYYNNLRDALSYKGELVSLTVTFNQNGLKIYAGESLGRLRSYLTVVGTYQGGSTEYIDNYSLSGTLTVGTSTITVSYRNITTTFNVTVSSGTLIYDWDFTQSLTDTVNGTTAVISDGMTRTLHGISFTNSTQMITFGTCDPRGKTFEYDITEFDFKGSTSNHIRQLMLTNSTKTLGTSPFMWRSGTGWSIYGLSSSSGGTGSGKWGSVWGDLSGSSPEVINCCADKTVRINISQDGGTISVYLNEELIGTQTNIYYNDTTTNFITFGGLGSAASSGDQCYDSTITGFRILEYNEEE